MGGWVQVVGSGYWVQVVSAGGGFGVAGASGECGYPLPSRAPHTPNPEPAVTRTLFPA